MAIEDGSLTEADEVMNALGSNFNDTAQNIFNADYIGFDSRLHDSGVPNYKNVFYSTFTSDDASTATNFEYDATDDLYKTSPVLTGNSDVYIIIEADDIEEMKNERVIFETESVCSLERFLNKLVKNKKEEL